MAFISIGDAVEKADFISFAQWYVHFLYIKKNSCIDIYAHSCLKPFLIGRKPCSNHEIHVPFEHGFWPTSLVKVRDVMYFIETKWPTLKKLRGFRCVFTLLILFSRDFKLIRVKMQE